MRALRVDVWADIACPWCWIGKRRLEKAAATAEADVSVHWWPFELNPGALRAPPPEFDQASRLADKYGISRERAQAMIDRVVEVGAEAGLDFRFDGLQPVNTFDCHRLLAFAAGHGCQDALEERLFAAHFSEGRRVSDHVVLADVAAGVGLDENEVRAVLASDACADEVRAAKRQTAARGITGVPFFLIEDRHALQGAQPSEVLVRALRRAAAAAPDRAAPDSGPGCDPDGCELPPSR